MKTLWVKRTNGSSYFTPDFTDREKMAFEAIPGVHYLAQGEALPAQGPICLLTNTHTQLPEWESIRNRVELILHPNSGMDNLAAHLKNWSVPVVLGHPIRAHAVAEWVLSCLLQNAAAIQHHSVWPTTRQWARPLLREQKILLVGHGHVGPIVAAALRAMGVQLGIHDPHQGMTSNLHEQWDVVILLASLNPDSKNLLASEFFGRAKNNVVIINPARSELIDESALRAFCKKNPQARAYLDVHAYEPYPAHYWDDCPQVIATPHIAGVWGGLLDEMLRFEVSIIRDWIVQGSQKFVERHKDLLAQNRLTQQGWYR